MRVCQRKCHTLVADKMTDKFFLYNSFFDSLKFLILQLYMIAEAY